MLLILSFLKFKYINVYEGGKDMPIDCLSTGESYRCSLYSILQSSSVMFIITYIYYLSLSSYSLILGKTTDESKDF
jgi:hypothetical protein